MSTQLDLFGPVAQNYRTPDQETSVEAGRVVRLTDRARALDVLKEHPDGLTDYELADLMNRQQNSAGKRRGELVQLGFVEDSGQRRPAPSGSRAIVWRVVR